MNESIINQVFSTHFSSVGKSVRTDQRVVIESVLRGNNTLCLMPTGRGKSLCYWVAGKSLGGTTLAIFPLTALMDEQAEKLMQHGMKVLKLHAGIDGDKQTKELLALYRGQLPDYILLSPERLATDGFLEFVLRARRDDIKLVVIDEIHCISQWGLDFRPFYKEIPPFLNVVFGTTEHRPVILGLTATLNKKDQEQVCRDFAINKFNIYQSQYLLRLTIDLNVVKVEDELQKDEIFWLDLNQYQNEKTLVYVENRNSGDRSTEGMCAQATRLGFKAAHFHGNMDSTAKLNVIHRFKANDVNIVFATSAFGMGIDIPDIRRVIHYRPPESIEQYYQQIGRAGRDGKKAWAILYYSDKNISFRRSNFIDRSFPKEAEVRNAFIQLTSGRDKIKTVNYFQETDEAKSAFHYLLRSEALEVICKGIGSLDAYEKRRNVNLPEFDRYINASPAKVLIAASKRSDVTVQQLVHDIYQWQAEAKIEPKKATQKCLVIEQKTDDLPDEMVASILADIAEKKHYRNEQLDLLLVLLEDYNNSLSLHQSIGRHLGIDEFQLGRIHETVSGVMVRSKSEVIIANLLTENHVHFEYEATLRADGQQFAPDFTVYSDDGKVYYWEHLGILDQEDYRRNWEIKHSWYERNFPRQLITTEELPTLSRTTKSIILEQFGKNISEVTGGKRPLTLESEPGSRMEETNHTNSFATPLKFVRVFTEGQTDWKHLKAAWNNLRNSGKFLDMEIEFIEEEQDVGDQELLKKCQMLSRFLQPITTICMFDRDVAPTLRQIVDKSQNFKAWGNRVYSMALIVPDHRAVTPNICIEFYYRDEEIMRQDENGRRLFLGTEFRTRTLQHQSEPLLCADRNKAGKFTIIDSQVFRISQDSEENIALSKNEFADHVLQKKSRFDNFDLGVIQMS